MQSFREVIMLAMYSDPFVLWMERVETGALLFFSELNMCLSPLLYKLLKGKDSIFHIDTHTMNI